MTAGSTQAGGRPGDALRARPGGTAERTSVELRRSEEDGEYRFYIVGRDMTSGEPLTETIDVQAAHERRHPLELFTADKAAPVFIHYVEHQTVPDGYTLRLIADT